MRGIVTILIALAVVILHAQDEEYGESIMIFQFAGRSEVIYKYLQQQKRKARFHVIFIVSAPRSFVWGEAVIKTLAEQFVERKFPGSISAIVRSDRYYADRAYLREYEWNFPVALDGEGLLLKPINAWERNIPFTTVWDSAGTLWWWAAVDDTPTGKDLSRFLDSLYRSSTPLLPQSYFKSVEKGFSAATVGWDVLPCTQAPIARVLALQDDSSTAVGKLVGPVISGNGQWVATFDFHQHSIRVFELASGKQVVHLKGDKNTCRSRSWYLPEAKYKELERYLWSSLVHPQFSDSVLWTIQVSSFVKYYNEDGRIGIDKSYYLMGCIPPCAERKHVAEFHPMTRTFCTGEYCAEGTFHPGGGFTISKGCFWLPFRRGYLAMGSDSMMVRNPFENPLADTFYTYAPLYGAFNSETGEFLDSTLGALNETVGKRWGVGLSLHGVWHLGCNPSTGQCAWVQWLVPEIEFGDGSRIPLKHYWNNAMVESAEKTRSRVPTAREFSYIRDSAGAEVERVILTPAHVLVLWKVKKRGYPLHDDDHGFWVVQQYDLQTKTLKGEWQLPREHEKQRLVDIVWDAARKSVAGLYQGPWKTSMVYYALDVP
ncbi:MAG: hypothetical protein RMK00_09420 [Bacteroidota bacterium]|nr:hypothetical protein [Bacteroidota bacterium]